MPSFSSITKMILSHIKMLVMLCRVNRYFAVTTGPKSQRIQQPADFQAGRFKYWQPIKSRCYVLILQKKDPQRLIDGGQVPISEET